MQINLSDETAEEIAKEVLVRLCYEMQGTSIQVSCYDILEHIMRPSEWRDFNETLKIYIEDQ